MTEWRFLAFLVWGFGTVVVYTIVLLQERAQYRLHRDQRSRRDMLEAVGLFLTALGSALAIALVLFGEVGTSVRGFSIAIALGAFTGVGIVKVDSNLRRKS